nr:MAG TPA: hypothetical protein [Caudoviricetes sp.]
MLHQDYYSLLEDVFTVRLRNDLSLIVIDGNDDRCFIGLLAGDRISRLHVIRVIVFVLLGKRLSAAEVAVSTHTIALNGIIVFQDIFSSFYQIIEARNFITIVVARRKHVETQRRGNDRAFFIIVIIRGRAVVLRYRDTVEEAWRRIFVIFNVPRFKHTRYVNEAMHDFTDICSHSVDECHLSLPHLIMVPIEHALLCCILSSNDILLGIAVDHHSCLELARESEILIDAMLSKIETVEDDIETVATTNLRIHGIGKTLGIVEDSVVLTFGENSSSHLTIIINLQHFFISSNIFTFYSDLQRYLPDRPFR